MISLEQRLVAMSSVNADTGCLEWFAAKDGGGYGMIRIGRRTCRAHRISFEVHFGPIPDGMCVCHRCDNRLCIKPSHLFLGTQTENMADRDSKGRQPRTRGERHGSAKLSEVDVSVIRNAEGGRGLLTALAKQFGVSRTQIANVRAGKNWSHRITEEIAGADCDAVRAAKAMVGEVE
jgi:hypothetical protein